MPNKTPKDKIELHQGDITKLAVDAIVNAANAQLVGGGGVDGAIHRAAGPELLTTCQKLGGCQTGSAKITPGFNLPAKYVIHAVGPIYSGKPSDAAQLAGCYRTALELASANELKSIAFSAISTGVYGYPFEAATRIAFSTTLECLASHGEIERVIFAFFGMGQFETAKKVFGSVVSS